MKKNLILSYKILPIFVALILIILFPSNNVYNANALSIGPPIVLDQNFPECVPFYSWWNDDRRDNFATTDPRWSMDPNEIEWQEEHISNGPSQHGYNLYRLEGYLFNPKRSQPPNTVPVFSWWNPTTQDNFATTDPTWSMDIDKIIWNGEHIENGPTKNGYTLYRLEGFIFDPDITKPNKTISAYSWWNPNRGDNFFTSDPNWNLNNPNGQITNEYECYRLEGYLYKPH